MSQTWHFLPKPLPGDVAAMPTSSPGLAETSQGEHFSPSFPSLHRLLFLYKRRTQNIPGHLLLLSLSPVMIHLGVRGEDFIYFLF